MQIQELRDSLQYIADSPPKECGGFDEIVVEVAAAALAEIDRLTKLVEEEVHA